jgi:hypothetical protein
MTWILDYLLKEWAVIKQAPYSFFAIIILCFVLAFLLARWFYRETLSNKNELIAELEKRLALRPISEEDVRKRIEAVEDESRKKIDALKDTLKAEYQSKIDALNTEHQNKATLLETNNKRKIEICDRAFAKLEKKYIALKEQLDGEGEQS